MFSEASSTPGSEGAGPSGYELQTGAYSLPAHDPVDPTPAEVLLDWRRRDDAKPGPSSSESLLALELTEMNPRAMK